MHTDLEVTVAHVSCPELYDVRGVAIGERLGHGRLEVHGQCFRGVLGTPPRSSAAIFEGGRITRLDLDAIARASEQIESLRACRKNRLTVQLVTGRCQREQNTASSERLDGYMPKPVDVRRMVVRGYDHAVPAGQ